MKQAKVLAALDDPNVAAAFDRWLDEFVAEPDEFQREAEQMSKRAGGDRSYGTEAARTLKLFVRGESVIHPDPVRDDHDTHVGEPAVQ